MENKDPKRPSWLPEDWLCFYAASRDSQDYPPSKAAFLRQKQRAEKQARLPRSGERPHYLPEDWESFYKKVPYHYYPTQQAFQVCLQRYRRRRRRQLEAERGTPEREPQREPKPEPEQLSTHHSLDTVMQALLLLSCGNQGIHRYADDFLARLPPPPPLDPILADIEGFQQQLDAIE
eukprot:scaffold6861_cov148-Amphora_coffeaeformis.AAC.8